MIQGQGLVNIFTKNSVHPLIVNEEKQLKLNMKDSGFMQTFGLNYFYQDLWGARKVLENNPEIHWDVGSSVYAIEDALQGLELNELSTLVNFVLEKVLWKNAAGDIKKDEMLLRAIEAGASDGEYGLFEFIKR